MEIPNLPKLNLPDISSDIATVDGQLSIWDLIRKKYVFLTPEEWVRQHFIHLLIVHLGYPKGLMRIEKSLKYHSKLKRSDIEIYDQTGDIYLLVECKSAEIKLNKTVLNQIGVYNKVLKAKHVAVTNGLNHFVWKYDSKQNDYQPLDAIPAPPAVH